MSKKRGRAGLVQQLQNAIEESGLTLGELSRRAGVATSQLSHFMRGERTLTLPVAEKICEALGLELSRPKKRKRAEPSDN
jgi:transcriptional regulator with XRE-family HTH domain